MSDIKGRPLIIAMSVVFGGLLVFTLINNGLNAAFGPDLSSIDLNNIDPTDPALQGSPILTLFSCLSLIVTGVLYVGAGLLYAYLHTREDALETQDAAIAGAVAAAVPAALNSVVSTGLSFLINGDVFSQVIDQLPPEIISDAGGLLASVGIISVLFGLCCVGVIGAALGAVGGAVGASTFRSK